MDEKSLKTFIRSILTSSPHDLSVRQLQRDFFDMIGKRLPFSDFGYVSIEHMLRSIPDTCTVTGHGEFAIVRPVITSKVAHINEMVMRQKVGTRKHWQGSRRRRGGQATIQPSRGYQPTPHYPQIPMNMYKIPPENRLPPNPAVIPKLMNLNFTSSGASNHTSDYDTHTATQSTNKQFQSPQVSWQVSPQTQIEHSSKMPKCEELEPKLQKTHITESIRRAISDSNKNDIAKKHRERINSRKSDRSIERNDVQHCEKPRPTFENRIPDRVQDSLKSLIHEYPDGMCCRDLPKRYRESFKRELRFAEYGYPSLILMCLDLKNIFYVDSSQDYGDYMLYDRAKPLPSIVHKESKSKIYNMSNMRSTSYEVGGEGSAHPERTSWEDFLECIPRNIVTMGETISRSFLDEDITVDSVIDIIMVEIYDPSKFWFYLADSELEQLMNDIQTFYTPEVVKRYLVPSMLIEDGLYCVQMIFGEYHRAVIVDVMPDVPGFVKLLYIDYGTLTRAPSDGICFLHRSFAELPAQAIRGRLANIAPPHEHTTWSRETNEHLRKMISGHDHKAKICDIDRKMLSVSLFVADVTEDDPTKYYYINEELVKQGRAVWCDQERKILPLLPNATCVVKQIHLYPTFFELEYGLAPNVNAMLMLEGFKVPLPLCYPHYFELNNKNSNDAQSMEQSEQDHVKRVVAARAERCRMKFNVEKIKECPPIDWNIFGACKGPIKNFMNYYGTQVSDSDEEEIFRDCDEEDSSENDNGEENMEMDEEIQGLLEEENEQAPEDEDKMLVDDQRVREIKETYKMSEEIMSQIEEFINLSSREEKPAVASKSELDTIIEEILNNSCESNENSCMVEQLLCEEKFEDEDRNICKQIEEETLEETELFDLTEDDIENKQKTEEKMVPIEEEARGSTVGASSEHEGTVTNEENIDMEQKSEETEENRIPTEEKEACGSTAGTSSSKREGTVTNEEGIEKERKTEETEENWMPFEEEGAWGSTVDTFSSKCEETVTDGEGIEQMLENEETVYKSLPTDQDARHMSSDEESNVTVRHLLHELHFFDEDSASSNEREMSPERASPASTFSARTETGNPNGGTSRKAAIMGKVNSTNPFASETRPTLSPNNPFRPYLEANSSLTAKDKVNSWISSQKFERASDSCSELSSGRNVSTGTQTTASEQRPVMRLPYPVVPVTFVPAVAPRWPPGFYPAHFQAPAMHRAPMPPAPPGFVQHWYRPPVPPGFPGNERRGSEVRIPQLDGETATTSSDESTGRRPRGFWDSVEERDGRNEWWKRVEEEEARSDLSRVDLDKVREFVPKGAGSFCNSDIDSIPEFVPRNRP